MKLTFNLKHLEKKDLRLEGQITAADVDLQDVDELVRIEEPIRYDLEVERVGQSIYVHGMVQFTFECQCARCLKSFQNQVIAKDWAWELPLEGEEMVEVDNDCVDLTPFVREDILLAFPQHPLCEVDCSGLLKAPQKRSQQKSGASENSQFSSAWAELNKLKLKH